MIAEQITVNRKFNAKQMTKSRKTKSKQIKLRQCNDFAKVMES